MSHLSGKDALDALYSMDDNEPEIDPLHIMFHLKQILKERNITQMQLAEKAGVRQATISQLCRGNVEKLHIPTLEKIAAALEITDISKFMSFQLESEIMSPSNPYDIDFSKTDE